MADAILRGPHKVQPIILLRNTNKTEANIAIYET